MAKDKIESVCQELEIIKVEAEKNRSHRHSLQQKLSATEKEAEENNAKKADEIDKLEQQLNSAVKVAQETTRKSSEAIDRLQEANIVKDQTIEKMRAHTSDLAETIKTKQNELYTLKRDEVLLRNVIKELEVKVSNLCSTIKDLEDRQQADSQCLFQQKMENENLRKFIDSNRLSTERVETNLKVEVKRLLKSLQLRESEANASIQKLNSQMRNWWFQYVLRNVWIALNCCG